MRFSNVKEISEGNIQKICKYIYKVRDIFFC